MREYLEQVVAGKNLSRAQARAAMQAMMSGEASETQIGALLTALKIKGETSEELAGMAETMRAFATPVRSLVRAARIASVVWVL